MRALEFSDIKAIREVRLVKPTGENAIVSAMSAWQEAQEAGLDLILVSDEDTVPPVVRIQDFKKILFEKKKAKTQQKVVKKHKSELKEIQLKANISDHDLKIKVTNIDRFLERGDKVKVSVRLKGRERDHPERARDLIEKLLKLVTVNSRSSKMDGPIAMAMIEPITASPKAEASAKV